MSQDEQEIETASESQEDADLDTANGEQDIDYKAQFEAAEAARVKAEEVAENQRIRAEKAEKAAKSVKAPAAQQRSPKADDISTSDIYALMQASVPQDDINDVKEYATLKGISVAEALKTNVVKTILADKAEQRTVSAATNVGSSKRGSAKASAETLLSQASKGQLPDSDEELETLIKARKGIK